MAIIKIWDIKDVRACNECGCLWLVKTIDANNSPWGGRLYKQCDTCPVCELRKQVEAKLKLGETRDQKAEESSQYLDSMARFEELEQGGD